jgi:hypothetical protein
MSVRAHLSITPWVDPEFVRTVDGVIAQVSGDVDIGSSPALGLAQALLRSRGYPRATVRDLRTSDEALRRVAHWQVARDGEGT